MFKKSIFSYLMIAMLSGISASSEFDTLAGMIVCSFHTGTEVEQKFMDDWADLASERFKKRISEDFLLPEEEKELKDVLDAMVVLLESKIDKKQSKETFRTTMAGIPANRRRTLIPYIFNYMYRE